MTRVVMPLEIRPGDVYLSAADGARHWVDRVFTSFWLSPPAYNGGPPRREEIVILVCQGGCRKIQVHGLNLPVLVDRAEGLAEPGGPPEKVRRPRRYVRPAVRHAARRCGRPPSGRT